MDQSANQVIAPELLEILVCPETHQALTLAPADLLARLNAAQAAGTLKNRAGQAVADKLDAALVRADGQVAYAIVEAIPVMLIEEQLALNPLQ
jgi:uncharacterized protein YbaR (Trm112 family)